MNQINVLENRVNKSLSSFQRASADVLDSIANSRLWMYLGWSDIKQRYRGSLLGPLWITLSMVIFIGTLSIVYTRLFHQEIQTFLPFLTAGMLSWAFISTVIAESSDTFVNAKSLIENIKLPYLIHLFRMIWRNQIIFVHNLIVFVVVAFLFHVPVNKTVFLFIPAFVLVTALLSALGLMTALLGTRFRDVPPVINSVIMVVFFVSPVTWSPGMIGLQSRIIKFNPVYYIMDLMRSPLLGSAPSAISWLVCLAMFVLFAGLSLAIFARFRARIPFWI